MTGLTGKVAAALIAVLAMAITLTTTLNILRYEEAYDRLVTQRLDVIASEIKRDLLIGIDLGLQLNALENLQDILQRPVNRYPDLANVAVYSCQQQLIASSGDTPATAAPPSVGTHFNKDSATVTAALTDSLGACAGYLSIAQHDDVFAATRASVRQTLIWAGLIAMLVALPSLYFIVRLFRRHNRLLDALNSDASQLESQEALDNLTTDDAISGDEALLKAYVAAREPLRNALQQPHNSPLREGESV